MQISSKRLTLLVGTILFVIIMLSDVYFYSLNQQAHQKIIKIENELKLKNKYTDMLDFAYNFMSRLTSEVLFQEPDYYQKHLTTNVFELLKSNVGWEKKILHYSISGVTISGNGQSILKVDLTVINKFDKQQTVVIYLYIEGESGNFIITHLKDHDVNNPKIHQEA